MYEQVFNFNSRPFTSTPYVKHYFPSAAMNQAFGQASICIERGSGPVVATGDLGTGKSLLLAKLESEFQTTFQVVNLVCSSVNSRREFLQNILFQIGKPFNMDSETELRFAVNKSAQPTAASPNGLLLLIDDAEMLTADVFDELRVLSNIVIDGSPRVRVVLAGRKSLEERLADPAHASFSQRIASRVFLNNLSRDETADYVVEHINRVGGNGATMFPGETTSKLHELTDGCPRLINQVCDFGLILAGTRGLTTASASLVEEAWNDVQSLPMGSGSGIAESYSQSAESTVGDDWTLIEFGQLEEDSPQPQDATVYDFENSAPVEESIQGYSPQEDYQQQQRPADIAETFEQPQLDTPTAETSVDPELGVDLGSLQAMQDAAAAKHVAAVPSDSATASPELAQELQVDTSATKPEDPSSPDDVARIAMEQQMAAVFGASLPSSTPAEATDTKHGEATPIDPAATASAGLEPAEQNQPSAQVIPGPVENPEASSSILGGAAGSAFAATAFAAAVNSISDASPKAPASPAEENGFEPATSALSEANQRINEPVTNEQLDVPPAATTQPDMTGEESQPAESFAPAFPVDATSGFVPATRPMEVDEATTEPAVDRLVESPVSEEPESAAEDLQKSDAAPFASPVAAENPFGEDFAVEANVPNRPTSEIIEQNQNALKISPADLEHVQPIHDQAPVEIIHPTPNPTAETNSPTASAPVGVNWMPTPLPEATETTDIEATDEGAAATESRTSLPDLPSKTVQERNDPVAPEASVAESGRGFSIMPMAKPPVPTEPAPTETVPVEPAAENFAPHESVEPAQATSETAVSSEPANAHATHNHDNSAVSEDISRQADAILARLKNANRPQVAEPQVAEPQVAEPQVTEPQVTGPQVTGQQVAGQEERILADIQQQQREVTDSKLLVDTRQPQTSLPLPDPVAHQDDSEMLVVNQEASVSEPTSEPETFPMTDSPVSSGRASRMDYENLFDRLRNLPDGEK